MDSIIKQKISARQAANRELLSILEQVVDRNPDLRLGQILLNCKFIEWSLTEKGIKIHDPFYEEPVDTLNRVRSVIESYE